MAELTPTAWACVWIIAPARALLSQPVLLGEFGFLAGILLFLVGKPLGAPLQFFHERPSDQTIAGFAATLTAAHLFFVVYLVESRGSDGLLPPLALWFVALWFVVSSAAVTLRALARWKPTLMSPRYRLSPYLRGASMEVSPLPFAGGVVLGFGFLALIARVLYPQLSSIDHLAQAALSALGQKQETHPGLHLVALSIPLLVLSGLLTLRNVATPAVALCSLLAMVAAVVGASNYWFGASTVVVLLGLVLLAWAGRELYAIRVPELARFYAPDAAKSYPPAVPRPSEASLPDGALLADLLTTKLTDPGRLPAPPSSGKQPLVLVCASGGGVRAAVWTAGLLARLREACPDFSKLTLMITGASGGMVGAAYWLAERRLAQQGSPKSWSELVDCVGRDSLNVVMRTLVRSDVPKSFVARANRRDRGLSMQQHWAYEARKLGLELDVPLSSLRAGEQSRLWPSLVFSPMIVEDGRRLLLSNLRLAAVAESESLWLDDVPPPATVEVAPGRTRSPASHSAFHAFDIFGAEAEQVSLATAARLSASFPYISPAVVLPTTPRTRVVDAGYYDDYGIDLATGWLREALEHNAEWLAENVSGILVIQIRDDISILTEDRDQPPKPLPTAQKGPLSALGRGLEGLTSPLQSFVAARGSVMQLRNDSQLDAIARAYETRLGKEFIAHEVFELKGDVSLSWQLTYAEQAEIKAQIEAVERKIARVANWLGA